MISFFARCEFLKVTDGQSKQIFSRMCLTGIFSNSKLKVMGLPICIIKSLVILFRFLSRRRIDNFGTEYLASSSRKIHAYGRVNCTSIIKISTDGRSYQTYRFKKYILVTK